MGAGLPDHVLKQFNEPFDPIRHEFQMVSNIYHGLKLLTPEAPKRVIEHVVGMLDDPKVTHLADDQ